jgi:hypothetical protein
MNCKICESLTDVVGEKAGRLAGRAFVLRQPSEAGGAPDASR